MKQEAAPVVQDEVVARYNVTIGPDRRKGERRESMYDLLGQRAGKDRRAIDPPKVERGEELREALRNYGRHFDDCPARLNDQRDNPKPCACGLDAALASPPVEQVPREPTKAMYEAGMLIDAMSPADPWEALKLIWQAMYDAAPVEGRNKGES